ncbi:hypothetical protein KCP78_18875 [Salmonella enterica subsp. enterica]|nr:hypothetical protein KCP78_18875 [Salmonella enterica subsp. enterica]
MSLREERDLLTLRTHTADGVRGAAPAADGAPAAPPLSLPFCTMILLRRAFRAEASQSMRS